MSWFTSKKKKDKINLPKDMSPLESVTHLCALIQMADGRVEYEEKQSWSNLIEKLFPDFLEDRADNFLTDAFKIINDKQDFERDNYTLAVIERIKVVLDGDQLKILTDEISELIKSDGIIMTKEIEIAKVIERELDLKINLDED